MIHAATLSLEHEFHVLEAALEAGVKVPRPVAYLGELGGREAFAMERVEGETIGRRIARNPPPGLDVQLAEELAKIHAIPPTGCPSSRSGDILERFERELDSVGEPHPAIEYGLWWLREHRPAPLPDVVTHGDFRIGNVVVSERGLEYLLDWEFAHLADPREDLAWPLVRAWRFGADDRRLGGVGEVAPYLERYAELTGRERLRGGALLVGGARQRQVGDRLPHAVPAPPDRARPQRRVRRARADGRRDGVRAPPPDREPMTDRPTALELLEAVEEFLSSEMLPTLDDQRLKFRTLVAMNALGIARRELEATSHGLSEDELRELARRIRAGDVPADAHAVLKEHVAAKLRISNPQYLERYE